MTTINATTFDALMSSLGPFEDVPHLAVAVSGGADSMALVLLADDWVRGQGGDVTALTVDHGLRPASTVEVRQLSSWLKGRAIRHRVLRWKGKKPNSGIQAAARQARYELMTNWCQRHGILHLLTAHHGDDQAETIFMRQGKNSGPDGLSGMPAGRALNGVRLLRPLLPTRRKDMEATLMARRQPWLDDPSNEEIRFARVAARRKLSGDEQENIRLQALAQNAADQRRRNSHQRAALAAKTVRMHPAGFCWWDFPDGSDDTLTRALLADILLCIGGGTYRPRRDRLDRLYRNITNRYTGSRKLAQGRTLAGTRILPMVAGFLICREVGRLPPPIALNCGSSGRWDRFDWRLRSPAKQDLTVGPLGDDGWRQVRMQTSIPLPSEVWPGLPALRQGELVLAVPHLNFASTDIAGLDGQKTQFFARFSPQRPLQPDGLLLV